MTIILIGVGGSEHFHSPLFFCLICVKTLVQQKQDFKGKVMTLKKFLQSTNISIAKFSESTGINANTLQTYVHQTSEPTVTNAIRIIEATHGSVELKDLRIKGRN